MPERARQSVRSRESGNPEATCSDSSISHPGSRFRGDERRRLSPCIKTRAKQRACYSASARRHHDGVRLGFQADAEPAGARQQAGVERLDRVRIDRSIFRAAFEQRRQRLRNARIEAARR